jgi:hypothetical protein
MTESFKCYLAKYGIAVNSKAIFTVVKERSCGIAVNSNRSLIDTYFRGSFFLYMRHIFFKLGNLFII